MESMFHKGLFHLHSWNKNTNKIRICLVNHVYDQLLVGLLASFLCASLIFFSLYNFPNQKLVNIWFFIFIAITLVRFGFLELKTKSIVTDTQNLRMLYIIGSLLGGISWGIVGAFLLPQANPMQQILMVLMLAGVTAGAVPLSAGIPTASILFLLTAITPFIINFAKFQHSIYLLFDIALTIYLIYSIVLTVKLSHLIRNSIRLQFENDSLLQDLENSNKKLVFASTHDPLTNLPNRRFFEQKFEQLFQQVKAKKPFALFYIDLDHFKEANDRHGHSAGDCILITISSRLSRKFGRDKIIARLGGDEIAIIVAPLVDNQHLAEIAKTICRLVAEPIPYGDIKLYVTASIGISIYPEDGRDPDQLLIHADKRMYEVKREGGNNFHLPSEESLTE